MRSLDGDLNIIVVGGDAGDGVVNRDRNREGERERIVNILYAECW